MNSNFFSEGKSRFILFLRFHQPLGHLKWVKCITDYYSMFYKSLMVAQEDNQWHHFPLSCKFFLSGNQIVIIFTE